MKIQLIVFISLLLVTGGLALKCYMCDDCKTPTNLTNCAGALSAGCGKVTIDDLVSRTCTALTTDTCLSKTFLGITTETCNCQGDMCNGSGMVKASTILATLISFILAKIFM